MPPARSPAASSAASPASAFSLIELLVAMAIFTFMALMLVSISNHAATIWSTNQRRTQLREKARTVLEFIADEMRQATLPLDPEENVGPAFFINPTGLPAELLNRDAVFWAAPIAATSQVQGDLAAIGYFIRREGETFKLCRFYSAPGDEHYALYDASDWVTSLVDEVAPATAAANYKGLLFENVLGLWVTPYDAAGNVQTNWDSRSAHQLPARVEISLAFVDDEGVNRLPSALDGDELQVAVSDASDANDFLEQLPATMRAYTGMAKINVTFYQRR